MKTTTTDATPKVIGTIKPDNGTAGIIKVTAAGTDGTDAVTSEQVVRFKKSTTGTLTLGTPEDVLAAEVDTAFSGAGVALSASSNNVAVTVTGKASKNIKWVVDANVIVP